MNWKNRKFLKPQPGMIFVHFWFSKIELMTKLCLSLLYLFIIQTTILFAAFNAPTGFVVRVSDAFIYQNMHHF